MNKTDDNLKVFKSTDKAMTALTRSVQASGSVVSASRYWVVFAVGGKKKTETLQCPFDLRVINNGTLFADKASSMRVEKYKVAVIGNSINEATIRLTADLRVE